MKKKLYYFIGVLIVDAVLLLRDAYVDFSVISVIGLVCTVFSLICICFSLKSYYKKV